MDKDNSPISFSQPDSLNAALAYAVRGLAVIPIEARGKKPLLHNGSRGASTDAVQIRAWWARWPDANVGIVTGTVSGLVVVDIDHKPDGTDGEESLSALVAKFSPLPATWEVITGGGGRHIFFRLPPGTSTIKNKVGLAPGIDIRGEGGYIVAPPSVHASGRVYTFEVDHLPDETQLAELPGWLLWILSSAAPVAPGSPTAQAVDGTLFCEGQRNQALTSLAGVMRYRGMSAESMAAALVIENRQRCKPPLAESEVVRTVQSVARYSPTRSPLAERGAAPTHTVGEFVTVPLSEVTVQEIYWLWYQRIPVGRISIIEGPPGVGKTTLAMAIAAAVTTGGPLPGGRSPEIPPSAVLFCSAEDGAADTLLPRARCAGADLVYLHVVSIDEGRRLPVLPNDLDALEKEIRKIGARLVILDPLMAFFASGIDSHKDQDVRRVLAPLNALAERCGAAILLLRHLNKTAGRPAIFRGGGSIGIVGAARSALLAAKDPRDESTFVLAPVKCNLSPSPRTIKYRLAQPDEGGATRVVWMGECDYDADDLVEGATGERSAIVEAECFLRTELADGPIMGKDVLARAREAGIADTTLRRAKMRLGVKSEKQKAPGGKWVWLPPPEDHQSANKDIFELQEAGESPKGHGIL